MDATDQDTKPLRRVGRPRKVLEGADAGEATIEAVEVVSVNPAQAYADRVWSGQSIDVPVAERLQRVRAALAGQGMDCTGVALDGNKL